MFRIGVRVGWQALSSDMRVMFARRMRFFHPAHPCKSPPDHEELCHPHSVRADGEA